MYLPQQNNGLNGFWGRLFTKLAGLVSQAISVVSVQLANLFVDTWNNNAPDSWFNKTTDYQPTTAEEIVLTNWTNSKFVPFHKQLLMQVNSIITNTSLNYTQQLDIINSVLQKMCLSKAYLMTNDTAGLSANALLWRNDFVNEMYLPISQIIDGILKNKTVELQPYTLTTTVVNYSPLTPANIVISDVECEKYVIPATVSAQEQNTPVQVTTQDIKEVITATNTTTGGNTGANTTKDNSGNIIGFVLLAAATIAILFSPNESKKKQQ